MQISMLMSVVAGDSGRPVIDRTNLKDLYDFNFQFSPDHWSTPPPRPNDGTPAAALDRADTRDRDPAARLKIGIRQGANGCPRRRISTKTEGELKGTEQLQMIRSLLARLRPLALAVGSVSV